MNGLPWFRMYSEAVDDEKLRLLAFEDRWHFVALLCLKAMGTLDSGAPHLERRIALKLGLQLPQLDEVKRRLMEIGLVDDDWQPTAWDKRQFKSDHSGAERKRNQRIRHRDRDSHNDVTTESRDCPGLDTEQIQSRADTEADTSLRSVSGKTRKHSKATNTVPESFMVDADLRSWTLKTLPDFDVNAEFETFRSYEFKRPYHDWKRVWQRWVLNGKKSGRYTKRSEIDWTGATKDGRPPQWM